MNNYKNFKTYLNQFERRVLLEGTQRGIFSKKTQVSRKKGKLVHTEFGRIVGSRFNYHDPLVFDYYGLQKKSTALLGIFSKNPYQILMLSITIYFASIKMEHISTLAPDLLQEFQTFKNKMIELRKFRK